MATDENMQFQLALAELRHKSERAAGLRSASYSPWVLAASVSAALGLFIGPVLAAVLVLGSWWWAALAAVVVAPVPIMVTRWAWRAYGVELFRLTNERQAMAPAGEPEPTTAGEPEPEPVELRPGWELNGVIVAREAEPEPAAMALRDCCLRFVRAGMRRGGWSRSTLAEGPSKIMAGPDWDRASRELQRLHYFSGSPLRPARDLGDILKRLELAR